MTKILRFLFVFYLLFVGLNLTAQTDSANMQIQKEALQMRETLNQYLSDKLLVKPTNKNVATRTTLIDSICEVISQQYQEMEMLKQNYSQIAVSVAGVKSAQENILKSNVLLDGIKRVNDTILEVYFAFDSDYLSANQQQVIHKFIGRKSIKGITLSGYCDYVGNEKYNQNLSKKRCLAVKRCITRKQIKVNINSFEPCNLNNRNDALFCRKVVIVLE